MNRQPNEQKSLIDQQLTKILEGQSNTLNLQSCNITDLDVQYISEQNTDQIQIFKLGKNDLLGQAVSKMCLNPWKNLLVLQLSSNKISNQGCRFIVKGQWRKLKQLWLFNNEIGQPGAIHLSKGDWKELNLLHLSHNHISHGIQSLLKGNWKGVQKLYLRWNQIEFTKLMTILKGDWPQIRTLWLKHNMENDEERNNMIYWIHKRWQKLAQLIIW